MVRWKARDGVASAYFPLEGDSSCLPPTPNLSHTGDDDGADQEEYQENAELLYGLIHARYIITMHGMETMVRQTAGGACPAYS